MSKKKIATLLIAGTLTVAVVGGTLAWFTSSDSVVNKFSIATTDDNTGDSGIKIHEEFNEKNAKNITSGETVTKKVQVYNTASYPQFIKVKLIKQFTKDGKPVTEQFGKKLDTDKIVLNLNEEQKTPKSLDGMWYRSVEDDTYYYLGKVGPKSYTNTLLDSVTLSSDAGNEYKNLGFEVKVEATSTEASNDAYKEWAHTDIQPRFEKYQGDKAIVPIDKEIPLIPTN